MAEHTPTPWHTGSTINTELVMGFRDNVEVVISESDPEIDMPLDEASANAAFIVKACNSHDALVKALNGMVEMYADMVNSGDCGFWDPEKVKEVIAARAALSLSGADAGGAK